MAIQRGVSIVERRTRALAVLLAGALLAICAAIPSSAWQVAVGGHLKFEVASVTRGDLTAQNTHSNVPLDTMDSFSPTGGLLQATNYPLLDYIIFAYKTTSTETQSLQSQLPKWALANHYDIDARASGNPTKDQFRRMMQALLADRFKLAIHYETKEEPVLALVMDKPGKLGSHIQMHPADGMCSTANAGNATVAGGYPQQCGVINVQPVSSTGGGATSRLRVSASNVPLSMLTNLLGSQPIINLNKPMIDKTWISGNVDFAIEFSPDVPPGGFTPDPQDPRFSRR